MMTMTITTSKRVVQYLSRSLIDPIKMSLIYNEVRKTENPLTSTTDKVTEKIINSTVNLLYIVPYLKM